MNSPFGWIYKGKINVTILVMFMVLSLTPLLTSIAIYFFTTGGALEVSATRHLQDLASSETKLVREWFDDKANTIRSLANSPAVQAEDWAKIKEMLDRTKKYFPEYGSLAFVNTKGKIVVDTTGIVGIDVSDRKYFKAAMSGQDYISEMIMARTYKRPCIVISSPVKVNGKIIGLVFGSVAVDDLSNVVMGFGLGKTGENYLVDRQGNLVSVSSKILQAGVDTKKLIPAPKDICLSEALHTKRDSVMNYTDYRGISVISVHRWLADLNILLITKQDSSEAIEEAGGRGLRMSLAAGATLVLLMLPVVWFIARRISSPLDAITSVVNQISAGKLDYRVKPLKCNEEIRNLGEQINELARTLKSSMEVIVDQMNEMELQREEITAQNEDVLRAYEKLTLANQSLQQMATTDLLTETYNRRYFMERLRTEVLISLRSQRPLTIALIDIDHFKAVNDTYGHKVGDQVLKGFATVISSLIRRSDLLARFGGEEFIILVPETSLEGAMSLAEKIRSTVAEHEFKVEGGSLQITISIGVAELNDFSKSPEKAEDQMLVVADNYLYEAKRLGRNLVKGGLTV